MNKWLLAIKAFDVFQHNIWFEDEAENAKLEPLVQFLRDQYEETKWRVGFQVAAWQAKAELLAKIEKGELL